MYHNLDFFLFWNLDKVLGPGARRATAAASMLDGA